MDKESNSCLIVAVVVTYMPHLEILNRLLRALVPQVTSIVIVNNGSSEDLSLFIEHEQSGVAEVLCLGANRGIATAQNIGIQWARERGAEFVLLMDQDSEPASDMVLQLLDATSILMEAGHAVACVGPFYTDRRHGNISPFVRMERMRLSRIPCTTKNALIPVDFVISSGCLIPLPVLNSVGGMQDDLFIDYVDVEWGLRARRDGYQCFGVCSAHMQHSLGEHTIKIFGRNIILHDPIRHYYQFRNAMLLYKKPWIPLNWKLVDGWNLCLRYVCYPLFAKPRMMHWRMMTLGVWHGLADKSGKFEGNALPTATI